MTENRLARPRVKSENFRPSLVSGGDSRARVDEGEDGVGAARARRPHERLAAVVVLHVDARAVAQEPAKHCDGFVKTFICYWINGSLVT